MLKSLQIVGNSHYGGGTYLILEWCKYLLKRKCQVDVLSTDEQTMRELKKIPGVRVIDHIFIPRDIAPLTDLKAFGQLLTLLRRERYDFVHTYTATPGFLGRMAARWAAAPVILHHQAGWTVTEFSTWKERLFYTPLEYLGTCLGTKGICVSNAVAEEARRLKIAPWFKLVTICNGIDPGRFVAAAERGTGSKFRRDLGLPEGGLLMGSTGRLSPQKDYATLIRALNIFSALKPDKPYHLVLAGEGHERPHLEALVRSLGMENRVHFLGFRQEIPEFLASLDIFVMPSLWEGLSISVMEAMAAARPIVATSILPNRELIEPEVTGLLVPPRDPEKMGQTLARLASDPGLAQRCGQNAQQRVLEHYTIDRMFLETWNLYISLWERQTCQGRC